MALVPFTHAEADMRDYARLVCSGMSVDDVHTPAEFAPLIADGRVLAWWWLEGGEKVGWCALCPWHGKYAEKAWHLYGVWVREDWRRKGLAEAMWRARIAMVPPQIPVTVSVQPGKTGSEALLRKLGFQQVCWNDPWFAWVLEG